MGLVLLLVPCLVNCITREWSVASYCHSVFFSVKMSSSRLLNEGSILHRDSGQNSMEYWDYSVEIECLKGPQG